MSTLLEHPPPAATTVDQATRSQDRLKFYFAILSALGGLVLATGQDAEMIPVIAVFFAAFGFVFVDSLKLFAVPPAVAYILMGMAAVYCVSDFWKLDTPGNRQMLSVAQLLVFVQAILMLQKKTLRIFEQLGVFCLLELVVAAVFNDALNYGLILLPIGLIAVWALTLLASVTAMEGLEARLTVSDPGARPAANFGKHRKPGPRWIRPTRDRARPSPVIRFAAVDSIDSLASAAAGMARFVLLTLAPAIVLVGAVFFYVLPRTTDAARMEERGNALVGFNDQMRLEQLGQMLQSTEPALRVRLSDRRNGRPYGIIGGMYLRGQVLETYEPLVTGGKTTATWSAVFGGSTKSRRSLPREYLPPRLSDTNFYDSVSVDVTCESMQSPSLFTIAPHFRIKSDDQVFHADGRWTLSRDEESGFFYPRIRYSFGTHAFRDGVQSDVIAAPSVIVLRRNHRPGGYLDQLSRFDADAMPTVAKTAREIRDSIPAGSRTDLKVAKAMENFLANGGDYEYTLQLNAVPVAGMDAIEQFMAIHRRGHCQYFASALVMMLRSVNIPARIVVGYRTGDFNEIGQYYLARQSDAHAWVEALLSKEQLGSDWLVYGQPPAEDYWLRLDPTPGGGGAERPAGGGGVEQVLTLARNIWEEYVVEMDADRQNRALSAGEGSTMLGAIGSFIGWVQQKAAAIRAGRLGGGSLAVRDFLSWRAAAFAGIVAITLFFLLGMRLPRWIGRHINRQSRLLAEQPKIPFYAETLQQMARLGITRTASQTPKEFSDHARVRLQAWGDGQIVQSLQVLTREFCQQRYGDHGTPASDTGTVLTQLKNQVDTFLSDQALTSVQQHSPITEQRS